MKRDEPFNVLATNSWSRVPRAAAVGKAIFTAIGQQALGQTVLFSIGSFQLTLATAVGYLVTSAITSWAMKALAPKPSSFNNQSSGILVNSRNTSAAQDFVYGKIRKGGTVTFYETTGSNNKYLHQVIALAGHEVNDIGDIYINDEVVSIDSNGFVTGDTWKSKVRIYKHLGDQTTASDDFANVSGKNLANTLHTETSTDANFVGKGVAYLYVRYEYDRDVFSSGVPLVTAVVEGKKVYDPRTSTTTYSNNAALCMRDFLASSYGLNDTAIDDTFFQAAANECDEAVTLSGGGTQKRYTINGVVKSDEPIGSVLEDMAAAMAGTLYWGQGNWKLKAGAYSTPVEDFDLDDLRGPIQLDTRLTMRDNFNKVSGTFIDSDSRWITADYPQVMGETSAGNFTTSQVYTITEVGTTDFTAIGASANTVGVTFIATGAGSGTGKASAFLGEDNGQESVLDLPFTFVTSVATAQRLAKLTLLRAREQMTFTATFSMKAFEVEVGDIIRLTNSRYGWTNKTFEVVGWSLFADGDDGALKVNLTLRETSSAAFDWNAEEGAITSNNTTLPGFNDVSSINNLSASNTGFLNEDGNFVARISLDWDDVAGATHDHFEVQHKLSSESVYQSTIVNESRATILGYAVDDVVNYRVRSVNSLGVRGAFSPDPVTTITVTGDDTAPGAPTSFTASGVFAGISLSWTNPDADDLDVIEVYRNTSNSSSTATKVAEVKGDSFTDDGLPVNTTYFYWLKAKDRTGNASGFSSGQSAVTAYVTESNLDPTYTNSVDTAAVSAAAAQAAQTAAETAETNAETAQTAAETARTAAQTAQTAAETAKAGAETAETGATTAQTAAEAAQTAAETAKSGAETAETSASTSATNAATSETNAATSESNAATSATNASTSASDASTSATNAATSATTATTKASDAATSATAAAASASTASTKAGEASTSASQAATSATNASGSASSAATSATTAATSATNAEDAYESNVLTNILANGDFENGTPSADSDLAQSSTFAKFGSKSGKLQNTNSNPDILRWANSDIPFTYASGDKFTWGFWVYNDTGSSFTHEFGIAGDGGWAKKTVTITTGSWQFVQASGTGGSYPETGDFRLELRGTPSSSNIYFDGVILVRGEHDLETIVVDSTASDKASDASESASAAATSATSASTSATNAATSASTATTKASEASTSAANAATSETNAATSETNAATSESNASTSETNAATSETNASTSATNAATSATTASTKASDAASSATAAAASASTATTKAGEASTSASQAATSATNASGSSSSAATSATTAANARKRVQLVDGGVFNAGFELGVNGDAGAPAGWEVGAKHSNAFTVIGHHSGVNSSSPYASELCYGSDTTSAGDWWYIAKYFVAEPSQKFRVNAYVWISDTHDDPNGANAKFVDEDDWIVVARWYDDDGSLLSSSASRSATSYYNNANSTTDAPNQTWFQYISDYLTAPANTAYVKIEIAAVDANDTVISGNLYDYQTSSAFLGGNAHVRIDDVVFESDNGQILEIQKSALDAAESASAAATSETNAAASETAAASSASSASTSANTATTKASEASTSASQAATSATNASGSASSASTSASNAATSETNASNSASAASTSASAASTSASQAATSASTASTQASTATTKASEASTSATQAASSATDADASAINAIRTSTRQAKINHAAGMLAPQICLYAANYRFACWEDGTVIYKNGVELDTLDRGDRADHTLALGDRLTSSKPFYALSRTNDPYTIPLGSEAMADTRFFMMANRYDTQTVNIYPLADGNAKYTWSSTHDGKTPVGNSGVTASDISLTSGTIYTLNAIHSSGEMYFNISSDVPILVFKKGSSGDGATLFPPDIEIYEREATTAVTVDDTPGTDDNANEHIHRASDGVRRYAAFGTADGSGGDAEGHIGRSALGDEYVIPCQSIQNFWLSANADEGTTVTVKNNAGAVEATYTLAAGATTQQGGSQGSGSSLFGTDGPYYFSGTTPFALQAQVDGFADEEMHYGFRRDLKPRYGTEAVTEILQSSVTDLEGNQEAAIVMRAKAGTSGAQLELVAGDNVSGGSVSTARIDADNIILDGTVTATQIAAGTITADKIASNTITSDQIEAGSIVGSSLSAGTISTSAIGASAVQTGNLAPNSATTAIVNINSPLNLAQAGSAIVGGRNGLSDFDVDGFYVGRTSSDGSTADGFQLSHTSVNDNNDITGIVHDAINGFQIINPIFRAEGTTTTPNIVRNVQGQTITLVAGKVHTISVVGGGGGGGGASNETSTKAGTYHGTAGSNGGSTTATLTGASGYTGTRTFTASGGTGGARGEDNTNNWNRGGGYTPNAPSGENAGYGEGGAGAAGVLITLGTDRNGNDGSDAFNTNYGSGGGGGSPAANTNVNEVWWGNPGSGGGAGQVVTVNIDLTSATTNGTLTLTTLGSGGSGGTGFGPLSSTTSGDGGSGANGAILLVSALDQYASFTLPELFIPIKQNQALGSAGISISSFADNGTNHTILGPYTEDKYFHLSGNVQCGYSWKVDTWGFILYSSSPSTSSSWANVQSASGNGVNYSYANITNGYATPMSSLSYPPSTSASGTLIRYSTVNRAYITVTMSITGFLQAGDQIRHLGEWNGVRPYPSGLTVTFYGLGS